MSVKVNLLPGEVRARGQASRSRLTAGLLVLLLVLALAALTVLQRSSIDDARERLTVVQGQNTQLQADITALQPFADLETRATGAVDLLAVALGNEGSLARVLQDLSAVLPPNAELDSLTVTLPGEAAAPAAGGTRLVYGRLSASGQVLDGVAPGVERLIIDLDRVAGFDNAYVTTSAVDEDGVATFSIELDLGPEALTGRYLTSVEVTP